MNRLSTTTALLLLISATVSAQLPQTSRLDLKDDSGKIFGNEEILLAVPESGTELRAFPTDIDGHYSLDPTDCGGKECIPVVPYRPELVKSGKDGVSVALPQVQYPRANSFDPACNFLVGNSLIVPAPGKSVTVSGFRNIFSPMLILVKGIGSGEKIISARIEGEGLSINALWPSGLKSKGGVWRLFLLSDATEVKGGISLTVETEKSFMTKSITIQQKLSPESIFSLTADMTGCKEQIKPSPLFSILNLDYAPLAGVRALYDKGEYKEAEEALLRYFKEERKISNTFSDPSLSKIYPNEIQQANDALPESGFRFAVNNNSYIERMNGKMPVFYSFSDGNGGINWELNPQKMGTEFYQKHMHKWFVNLAKAYHVLNDEKYFNAWKLEYSDWLQKYPCPGKNGASYSGKAGTYGWKSWAPLTVANRIENQIAIFDYFLPSDGFDFKWLETVLIALADEVEYNRANPYYEHTSNIYLAQIRSIFISGVLFPEFKDSETWRKEGGKDLDESFALLFNADGCLNELDASYHVGVTANYLTSYEVAAANSQTSLLSADFKEKLYKSCRFHMDYLYPNYLWECFNDTRQTSRNVALRNLRNYSRVFPEDNEFKYTSTQGEEGRKPSSYIAEYPASGYYMLRSGWDETSMMLILKNNFNPKNKWHANLDNGTVGICNKGRLFLPDAGSYSYGGGTGSELSRMREEFRAAARHNTVTLNLQDIAPGNSKGRLLFSDKSKGREMVVTENDPYPGMTHRRTVWMVDRSFYVVMDAVYGNLKEGTLNLNWHLCADETAGPDIVKIDSDCSGAVTLFEDDNNMAFKSFCSTAEDVRGEQGLSDFSTVILRKSPRKFYRLNVPLKGETVRFITIICPFTKKTPTMAATWSDGGFSKNSESADIVVNGKKYHLSYSL